MGAIPRSRLAPQGQHIMQRKSSKARAKAKPRKAKAIVYTPIPLPPRTWAKSSPVSATALQGHIEHTAAWQGALSWPAAQELVHNANADWWHAAMAKADQGRMAILQSAIHANNSDVAALASGLDLGVRRIEGIVLQYDAVAMSKRIAAAGAHHKNRPAKARGSDKANRHLKYSCPVCGKAARSASHDRILLCGGYHSLPHKAELMIFDPGSQPDYRKADSAALYAQEQGEDCAPFVGQTKAGQSQSLLQQAAHKTKARTDGPLETALAMPLDLQGNPVVIPF